MAIEKMKKLRLLAVRDSKEELLKELIRHGCVEFSEAEDALADSEAAALVHPESSELSKLKAQHQTLVHAIDLLNTYAPKKTKMLSAKPELEDRVLLDDTGLSGALRTAETIEGYDARIKRIGAEESRLRSVIESLQPWLSLDLPLNFEGTERCSVLTGSIPARFPMETVSAAIEAVDEEAEIFSVHEEKKAHYVLLVCMREKLAEMQDALRPFGFTASALTGESSTAREGQLNAEQELKQLAAEKENCVRYIVDDAVHRDELKLAADRVKVKITMAETEERLCGTDSVLVMEGWCPAEREAELAEIFERYGCAVLVKGGHSINDANDVLYSGESNKPVWFKGKRIDNPNTHGTGCTLSSAIASNLAKGYSLAESVKNAKEYLSGALGAMLDLGKGSGPLNHMYAISPSECVTGKNKPDAEAEGSAGK